MPIVCCRRMGISGYGVVLNKRALVCFWFCLWPMAQYLYEDIAPLSSMGKKVYLCRIRASGQLAVESPGAVIPLPDLVEPRVTQIFHESGVDYAIIQGKDAAGGPMCALVTAPGGQANVFFLKNCREEDIQVRYTSKYIELVQPESNPKFWWRIENHDKVQLMEK